MIQKLIIFILAGIVYVNAQNLDGAKIYINPGHGGNDSDDRFIPETGFWESEGNLTKGLKLRDILTGYNAVIQMSRTQNRSVDDKLLSVIVAEANAFDADYMHSIHSNGFRGTANYTLMLFQGGDNSPTYPEAKVMATLMGNEIFKTHRTTNLYIRGDFDFYGTGGPYLGVFKGLNMPGTLSEGSFHDYIPESWRLQNLDYRKNEAWAMSRAFLDYFDAGTPGFGEVAGVVRDPQLTPDYYFIPSTNDGKAPVNSIKITLDLNPGTRVYQGDTNNNGFFLFDSVSPGEYQVYFEAPGYFKDTTQISVTANKTTFADAYLTPQAPGVPSFVRVLDNGSNSLRVVCEEAARASDYRVMYGTDGITFPDSVTNSSPEIILNGLDNDQVYYIKVKALNASGISPLTRDLYAGVPSAQAHTVLVVDGFDRSTNTRFDYIKEYANPLLQRGYPFSFTLNQTVESGELALGNFKTVIWILGDESTVDETFSSQEQLNVATFLRGGGQLLVSGSEIGWDIGRSGFSSSSDIEFYETYLKAKYLTDAPLNQSGTHYSVEGISGTIWQDVGPLNFDNGTNGTIDVDWPDAIANNDGSSTLMKFVNVAENNGVAGIAYEGRFPGGRVPGKLVYLTFPVETVYDLSARTNLIDRIFDFFEGETPLAIDSDSPQDIIAQAFQLEPNYPNPFNPTTTIGFNLPKKSTVSLHVFNVQGQLVRTLINKTDYAPGRWQVQWNGLNDAGQQVASGTYLYILSGSGFRLSQKMILIR